MTILKSTLVIALSLSIFDPGITQESKYTGQKPSNSKSESGSAQDVFCQNLMAHNRGKSDNQPATAYKSTRLSLELVKTEPVPVIGSQHSDAQDIPAGFEAGTTVKVKINGESAYHMVTSTMETFGATRWANVRTEHWISEDGSTWRRHKILFRPGWNPETGMWELTASPFFFFDEKEDRWFVYFNFLAYDRIRSWDTPTLLRRAGAKTKGMSGINGEFGYPGEIVAP